MAANTVIMVHIIKMQRKRKHKEKRKMNDNQFLQEDEVEIDLAELLGVFLHRWWLIAMTALLGFALAAGITEFVITPQYQSKAMLYILTKTTSVTSIADLQIGTAITRDFEIIATSKPVIDKAILSIKKSDGISMSRKEMKDMLTIVNQDDTRILEIRAVHENPEYSCVVANAVAEATAERMAEIMKSDPPTTVEKAEVEPVPVSPSLIKNSIIGILIGAVFMCGILTVQFMMNDNIKTDEDIQRYLGEVTLAMIPQVKKKENKNN